MPRIVVTEAAIVGLERCRRFLVPKNPRAAIRARQLIVRNFLLLETTPEIGRPLDDMPELRELIMGFGESGYVALYRYKPDDDAVYVLAFRHQREAGY